MRSIPYLALLAMVNIPDYSYLLVWNFLLYQPFISGIYRLFGSGQPMLHLHIFGCMFTDGFSTNYDVQQYGWASGPVAGRGVLHGVRITAMSRDSLKSA